MVRIISGITIFLIIFSFNIAPAFAENYKTYKGTINNKLNIHMILFFDENNSDGYYYYDKYKKNILLQEGTLNNQHLIIKEYDKKHHETGMFEGDIHDKTITGTWSQQNSPSKIPFTLEETDMTGSEFIWGPSTAHATTEDLEEADITDMTGAGFVWRSEDTKIIISNITNKDFDFKLTTQHGANFGSIRGKATIQNNQAVFEGKDNCKVDFIPFNNSILTRITSECSNSGYTGVGVYFSNDNFVPKSEYEPVIWTLFDKGVFKNQAQEDKFKKLVKKDYELFLNSFNMIRKDEDENRKINIYIGRVRGLGQSVGGIIMLGPDDKIWAAINEGGNIRYYTNDPAYASKLPQDIKDWKKDIDKWKGELGSWD